MPDSIVLEPIQAHEIDNDLERSLTHEWDAQIMTYPNERFPFNEWIRERIRKMGYPVEDLSYFHEVVPQADTYRVTKQLCADTNLPEFRRMLNGFVREVVVPKGKLRLPVAVQRFMNVRIMLPTTPELYFPLHTGLLYGHGVASRSIWMPFVDVTADEDKTRSMQIIPIKKSRELVKYAIDHRLKMAEMTAIGARTRTRSRPVRAAAACSARSTSTAPGCRTDRQDADQHGFPDRRGDVRRPVGAQDPGRLFPPDPGHRGGRGAAGATAAARGAVQERQAEHLLCREQHLGDLRHPGASAALHAIRLLHQERADAATTSCSTWRTCCTARPCCT